MLDISFSEIVLIFMVLLVLVRPKDIPKICYTLGQYIRKFKVMQSRFLDLCSSLSYEGAKQKENVSVEPSRSRTFSVDDKA